MELAAVREFLIQNGVTPEELDEVQEPPVIKDIGHAMIGFLQNDDNIGQDIVNLYMMVMEVITENAELKARVAALEGGN